MSKRAVALGMLIAAWAAPALWVAAGRLPRALGALVGAGSSIAAFPIAVFAVFRILRG